MSGMWENITGKTMREQQRKAKSAMREQREALERATSEEARKEAALKATALLRKMKGRSSTLLTGGASLGGWGDNRAPKATLLG